MRRPPIDLGLGSTGATASPKGSPASDVATLDRCRRFGAADFVGATRATLVQLDVTGSVWPVGRAAVEESRHNRRIDSRRSEPERTARGPRNVPSRAVFQ